ncbi:MAG: hypothetical protein ASUL_08809 [Candidatus Aramenus sulfurataquae]|uniref:Uncharacterized protein n=1 Tax=Candidatus Aramenus sulfurataquae TaxID=1326980 RepID=W7KH60_9CREN|nr:MAG: hypothetical protein ASUL_08809 [Candidatus Aramenus sulfurataquae]
MAVHQKGLGLSTLLKINWAVLGSQQCCTGSLSTLLKINRNTSIWTGFPRVYVLSTLLKINTTQYPTMMTNLHSAFNSIEDQRVTVYNPSWITVKSFNSIEDQRIFSTERWYHDHSDTFNSIEDQHSDKRLICNRILK